MTYKNYNITQTEENKLIVRKGKKKAEFEVDHFWTEAEMREFIDDYSDTFFCKEKRWEHKGYTLVQTDYNWHFGIFDANGKMVFHAQCTKRLTDEEAIEQIKSFIQFREEE